MVTAQTPFDTSFGSDTIVKAQCFFELQACLCTTHAYMDTRLPNQMNVKDVHMEKELLYVTSLPKYW